MKKTSQIQPPALVGRRDRISNFNEYLQSHRKQVKVKVMLARYSIDTGLSIKTVKDYLKLLIEAEVFAVQRHYHNGMLLTPKESATAQEEYDKRVKAREEERRKKYEEHNLAIDLVS